MDLRERNTTAQGRRHPWEVSRFEFFSAVMLSCLDEGATRTPLEVLDVGAGDAWFATQLYDTISTRQAILIDCWDLYYQPADIETLTASAPAGMTFTATPPDQTYDWVLALDVAEHVEDDVAFLNDIVTQRLADDGHVLLSVPAWPQLFSQHDVHLKHYRRYLPHQGHQLMERSGLEVIQSGGLFHSLLLPRALGKLRETIFEPSTHPDHLGTWRGGPVLTELILNALRLDNRVSKWTAQRRIPLPGLSWWALCRKSRS